MLRTIFLVLFFAVLSEGFAQEREETAKMPKNAVYIELAGNSLPASINYERIFAQKPGLGIAFRAGFILIPDGGLYVSVPTEFILIKGREKHFAEISAGMMIVRPSQVTSRTSAEVSYFLPTLRVGYRYAAPKGFLLRAGLTAFFGQADPGLFLLPGVCLGKSF